MKLETYVRPDGAMTTADAYHADSVVIIPTYNEAGNLGSLVRQILALEAFDMLVVDDDSPDGTGLIADDLARHFPGRVRVLHQDGKQGLGNAYIQGFTSALDAGYAHIFQMDADFSHDPASLPALRAALADADIVIGSRYVPGGSTPHWPLRRRVLSRCGAGYAQAVLGLPIHDVTSGFKGFHRHVLETLDVSTLHSTGFAFQIEVTYRCHEHGYRLAEVPIKFVDRQVGKSKMNGQIIVEALGLVWRLRFDHRRQERMHPWVGSTDAA